MLEGVGAAVPAAVETPVVAVLLVSPDLFVVLAALLRKTINGIATAIAMMIETRIDVYMMNRFRERKEYDFLGGLEIALGSYT